MRDPRGSRASSTTFAMRPSSITTEHPRTGSAPVPSMITAPLKITGSTRTVLDLQSRIERIAEPVTEQVDTEHGDQDRQARKRREPPRRGEVDASVGQHAAPRWRRRLDTEPQERERRLDHDDARHVERGHDQPGSEGVGQHVSEHDAKAEAAEADGRLDELTLADRQHPAPDDARV